MIIPICESCHGNKAKFRIKGLREGALASKYVCGNCQSKIVQQKLDEGNHNVLISRLERLAKK